MNDTSDFFIVDYHEIIRQKERSFGQCCTELLIMGIDTHFNIYCGLCDNEHHAFIKFGTGRFRVRVVLHESNIKGVSCRCGDSIGV